VKPINDSITHPSAAITYMFIFTIGLACMTVAGYFLVEGLSQFSGSGGARNMLIVGGVLFQITESLCFISASALTHHSLQWRLVLFALGAILFCFSIGVMTLAQKTALQTGEAQAQANDERREHIRSQMASLQEVIDSYRANAASQSRSIYKDSRALGQDSINRAAEMEERKLLLSEELFKLNSDRQQTSSDFFLRLEEVTGLPQKSTEFYFLVLRSLLLETSGIILMSFGANLRAHKILAVHGVTTSTEPRRPPWFKRVLNRPRRQPQAARQATREPAKTPALKPPQDSPVTAKPVAAEAASSTRKNRQPKSGVNQAAETDKSAKNNNVTYLEVPASKEASGKHLHSGHNMNYLATLVLELHEQNILRELNPTTIKDGLYRYCSHNVSQDDAGVLSQLINKRLDETC